MTVFICDLWGCWEFGCCPFRGLLVLIWLVRVVVVVVTGYKNEDEKDFLRRIRS
jgi:hypothetical protein